MATNPLYHHERDEFWTANKVGALIAVFSAYFWVLAIKLGMWLWRLCAA